MRMKFDIWLVLSFWPLIDSCQILMIGRLWHIGQGSMDEKGLRARNNDRCLIDGTRSWCTSGEEQLKLKQLSCKVQTLVFFLTTRLHASILILDLFYQNLKKTFPCIIRFRAEWSGNIFGAMHWYITYYTIILVFSLLLNCLVSTFEKACFLNC